MKIEGVVHKHNKQKVPYTYMMVIYYNTTCQLDDVSINILIQY